jgi:hypothetical protein
MLFFGVGIRPFFQPYNPGTIYDTAPSYRLDVHFTPFTLNRPDERFTVNQSSSFQQSYQKKPAVFTSSADCLSALKTKLTPWGHNIIGEP